MEMTIEAETKLHELRTIIIPLLKPYVQKIAVKEREKALWHPNT